MSEVQKQDMDDILDVAKAEERERRVLNLLLKNLHDQKDHHFVLRVTMGNVSSYLTSMTLHWVKEKVGFAADLPIFRPSDEESVIDEDTERSKRIPWDSTTMDQIQQRQPDWERQRNMAVYLVTRPHHKFPPLLLVGYQPWIYDERSEKWGIDGRATNDSLTVRGLESTGTYWDMDDSDTQFYALDGQHRLMAILGLHELVQTGQLPALDKNRKHKATGGISREEIIDHIHGETGEDRANIHERIQRLMEENIGVEIIPAVCRGETYDEALRRLRQVFVDVNENAKRLTKSQNIQLDEVNGFRIIARQLCQEHELFKSSTVNGTKRLKIDEHKSQLSENDESYTTLERLADTVECYLLENKSLPESEHYASWNNFIAKDVGIRPQDADINRGTQAMLEYFDYLQRIPSHTAFVQGKPGSTLRKSSDNGGEDNILFRPIVQIALAEALGKLATRGVPLKSVVEELGEQEKQGQLTMKRTAPWFGVVCDIERKIRRDKKSRDLCCRLFQYLLGGGLEDDFEREKLKEDFAAARQFNPDGRRAINLEGEEVDTDAIRLPNPWR